MVMWVDDFQLGFKDRLLVPRNPIQARHWIHRSGLRLLRVLLCVRPGHPRGGRATEEGGKVASIHWSPPFAIAHSLGADSRASSIYLRRSWARKEDTARQKAQGCRYIRGS